MGIYLEFDFTTCFGFIACGISRCWKKRYLVDAQFKPVK